jgi:hypothetical protein
MSRATLTDEAAMQAPASHGGIWMAVNGNRTPAVIGIPVLIVIYLG